ncbi:MAG TPA: helix-turn-helix domain-containing protein [Planctomycetota bacterium]|nr:helix-turn-helix domain-containing protein [Planctomycetota bacterium]
MAQARAELGAPVAGDTHACAARYGFTRKQLEHWRSAGGGPPYSKIGRLVRYAWADVDEWLRQHRVSSTAQEARAQ